MDTATHKILDMLEHIWPYITGFFIVLAAGARLVWYKLTNKFVTKDELKNCRTDVQEVDEEMLKKIDKLISDNAAQHQDIMKQIIRLHK